GSRASGTGVYGHSSSSYGVRGSGSVGVYGSGSGQGVYGDSTGNDGVFGTTNAFGHSGVAGISGSSVGGNGVYGTSVSCAACYAGYFDGKVRATGGYYSPGFNVQIDDPLDP